MQVPAAGRTRFSSPKRLPILCWICPNIWTGSTSASRSGCRSSMWTVSLIWMNPAHTGSGCGSDRSCRSVFLVGHRQPVRSPPILRLHWNAFLTAQKKPAYRWRVICMRFQKKPCKERNARACFRLVSILSLPGWGRSRRSSRCAERWGNDENASSLKINTGRFLSDFHALAQIGATAQGGVNRPSFSDVAFAGRAAGLKDEVLQAGLAFRCDEVGNHSAFLDCGSADAQTLLIGSHLDSVYQGGVLTGRWA